jgi:ABC-type cobalamin/Fe3+-siderophores transport system ATPase subunit
MTTSGNSHSAKVIGIMGATGCGKSHFLRKMLSKPARKRTLIWSPKEAMDNYASLYPGSVICTTASAVLQALKRAGAGPVHIVFVPSLVRKKDKAMFGAVCKMAKLAKNLTVIAEEIGTVVEPNGGPDGWYELITMGRAYGIEVFGLSQRPASIDKDFFSNMSLLHVGRLNYEDDMKACAKALRVPVADVSALSGYQWIERDILAGTTKKG